MIYFDDSRPVIVGNKMSLEIADFYFFCFQILEYKYFAKILLIS